VLAAAKKAREARERLARAQMLREGREVNVAEAKEVAEAFLWEEMGGGMEIIEQMEKEGKGKDGKAKAKGKTAGAASAKARGKAAVAKASGKASAKAKGGKAGGVKGKKTSGTQADSDDDGDTAMDVVSLAEDDDGNADKEDVEVDSKSQTPKMSSSAKPISTPRPKLKQTKKLLPLLSHLQATTHDPETNEPLDYCYGIEADET
jgi:hypothetical protein